MRLAILEVLVEFGARLVGMFLRNRAILRVLVLKDEVQLQGEMDKSVPPTCKNRVGIHTLWSLPHLSGPNMMEYGVLS